MAGTWRLDRIPASRGKAEYHNPDPDHHYFIGDSQTSSRMEEMIQGHKLIVTPAPESVKKSLARSEFSRKPLMVSTMSPVSRLLSMPLPSAREKRKSREIQCATVLFCVCHKFSILPAMSVPDRTILCLVAND